MKRSVISPVQRGEMGGISLDPMANPAPKGNTGTIACQKTSGHAQAYGVTRQGIRAIRPKLDCLKPNLQKVQPNARRKDA